jgi:DNA-binding XRE family transcriptional regulator
VFTHYKSIYRITLAFFEHKFMTQDREFNPVELKQARARLGFTQEQLASELGVSRVSVVRWETGTYKIPFTIVLAVRYLECKQIRDKEHAIPSTRL